MTDPNTADLIDNDAEDLDVTEVSDIEDPSYVPADEHTPPAPDQTGDDLPHNLGPFDADQYGTDAEGRALNQFGRYEGQHNDELAPGPDDLSDEEEHAGIVPQDRPGPALFRRDAV